MSAHSSRPKARITRRRVITAAATVGVGAAAVSVTGLSLAHERGGASGDAAAEPLIAHLSDPKTGTLEIFVGTTRVEVRDPGLAARLAKAARRK
jgi:hypothetical protein